jgi:hypothetical protein
MTSFISLLYAFDLKPGDVFPPFTARSLNDSMTTVPNSVTPKVTLIIFSFSRKDVSAVEAWTDTFTAKYKNTPAVSYIQAAVIPDMPFISGIIANAMKGAISKERQGDFLIYSGDKDSMMKLLSIGDQSLFYVYLTGKDGKIIKMFSTAVLSREYLDAVFVAIDKEIK